MRSGSQRLGTARMWEGMKGMDSRLIVLVVTSGNDEYTKFVVQGIPSVQNESLNVTVSIRAYELPEHPSFTGR